MEFATILEGYDYRDNNVSSIDSDSDSDSDFDGPDIFEPFLRSFSSYKGSVKPSSWIPRARAPSLRPNKPISSEPSLSYVSSIAPDKPKSKAMHTIGARITAITL